MSETIIFDAIEFAAIAHRGQYRKGSKVPYIIHPLRVGNILIENGYKDHVVVGGILHDIIEDTSVTIDMIENKFGINVASIVMGCTESLAIKTWEARKEDSLNKFRQVDRLDILVVAAADKLDNVKSIIKDYELVNDNVWNRFKRPKELQKKYYLTLAEIFSKKYHTFAKEPLFIKCASTINNFFNNI